ncbi:MAG: hypothetical protein JSS21_08425 [Proteobacteria bacterium]|nr:hypothetical protein [Pseudomonadota bacterium]
MNARFFILLPLLLLTTACVAGDEGGSGTSKVNGSVNIEAGQAPADANTVNGSIRVADKAKVEDASTVNGSISLGDQATAKSVNTVNGSVKLDHGAQVSGNIESVNGSLKLAPGAEVGGHATNVNGHIIVDGAHVGAGLETVDGDIDVIGGARVDGGILVRKPDSGGWFHFGIDRTPVVTIGPGATVNGTLKFEREVKLYVSDKAHVGQIVGATPVKFSGEQPPAN